MSKRYNFRNYSRVRLRFVGIGLTEGETRPPEPVPQPRKGVVRGRTTYEERGWPLRVGRASPLAFRGHLHPRNLVTHTYSPEDLQEVRNDGALATVIPSTWKNRCQIRLRLDISRDSFTMVRYEAE